MRKLVSSVALAAALISAPVQAQQATPSVADAEAFIAKAEKDLFDFSIEAGRVQWINSTYIIDDTDAIAAKYGEIGTEKAVAYALEAAKLSGPVCRNAAQAGHSCAAGWSCPHPTTEGAAAELNDDRDQAAVGLRQGQGHARRQADQRLRHRGGDGHQPQSRRTARNVDELARQCRQADEARIMPAGRNRQRGRAKNWAMPILGAMWRSNYDMPPDDFAALTDKLWQRGQAAL
jgi:peptidyl-dipeptidase A